MKKLKPTVLLIITVLLVSAYSNKVFSQAENKANKDTKIWRYEIECAGVGNDGTYSLKVWSYSKNPTVATEQAKKNAVHGVIFKGFTGGGAGCTQKPLTNNPDLEQQQMTFFKDFFADGGKYMKYVNVSGDGAIEAGDRMKIGKEYKIGVYVSVQKDLLRKDLEAAGIIKSLGNGF